MNRYYILAIMALVLAILPARAAIYIVGNTPFGNWDPNGGVEMEGHSDGTYTFTTSINGTVWFVFADGLTSDWTMFNANCRYGPQSNGSQDVAVGGTYTTQKSNNNHAYKFTGTGLDYTFTFNLNDLTFGIKEYEEPSVPDPSTLVGDVNGDGEINIADLNALVSILLGAEADNYTIHRADANYDGEVNIADVNVLTDYILGGELPKPVKQGYDYVWDDEVIPEIHITVSLDEWNRLLSLYDANAYTTKYVKATVSFVKQGETTVIDEAGLRIKGNTSRRRPEGGWGEMHQRNYTDWHHAHFGVNLRKYVEDDAHTIQGVRKLHLKWFKDDPATTCSAVQGCGPPSVTTIAACGSTSMATARRPTMVCMKCLSPSTSATSPTARNASAPATATCGSAAMPPLASTIPMATSGTTTTPMTAMPTRSQESRPQRRADRAWTLCQDY